MTEKIFARDKPYETVLRFPISGLQVGFMHRPAVCLIETTKDEMILKTNIKLNNYIENDKVVFGTHKTLPKFQLPGAKFNNLSTENMFFFQNVKPAVTIYFQHKEGTLVVSYPVTAVKRDRL